MIDHFPTFAWILAPFVRFEDYAIVAGVCKSWHIAIKNHCHNVTLINSPDRLLSRFSRRKDIPNIFTNNLYPSESIFITRGSKRASIVVKYPPNKITFTRALMLCATSPEILSSNTEIGLRWLLLPNAKVKWLSASYWSIRNAYIQFIEFPTSPIYIYPFCLELMSDRKNGCLRGNQPLIIELRFDSAPSDGMLDLVLCLQSE